MASGGGGAGRWTWWSRSSRSMPAPAGASETGSGLRRKTGGAVKNQLRSFTHQRSPLDVGSGRTSSPSAIAVDVHVTLPKSGPRPALRPNVVKGPPKPGTELLEDGKREEKRDGRNATSRRLRSQRQQRGRRLGGAKNYMSQDAAVPRAGRSRRSVVREQV